MEEEYDTEADKQLESDSDEYSNDDSNSDEASDSDDAEERYEKQQEVLRKQDEELKNIKPNTQEEWDALIDIPRRWCVIPKDQKKKLDKESCKLCPLFQQHTLIGDMNSLVHPDRPPPFKRKNSGI